MKTLPIQLFKYKSLMFIIHANIFNFLYGPHLYHGLELRQVYATVTSLLPTGIVCKNLFPILLIKIIKWTHLYYNSSCLEPGSDSCIQVYKFIRHYNAILYNLISDVYLGSI
jgi:hypothetical protein